MQTVVINNREGLVQAQMPHVLPTQRGESIKVGRAITFMPGANLVDSKVLATLRQNPAFEKLFSTTIRATVAPEQPPEKIGKPILEIDKSIGKNGEVEDKTPLAKLDAAQAESLIRETFVVDVLKKWSKEEVRGDVRRVIESQIELLNTGNDGDAKGPRTPAQQ